MLAVARGSAGQRMGGVGRAQGQRGAACSSRVSWRNRKSRALPGSSGRYSCVARDAAVARRDPHMDVRRASRIGDRLDGAEVEAAVGPGQRAAVALEVGIALGLGTAGRVVVDGVGIALPDLDLGLRERAAAAVEHAAGQVQPNAAAEQPFAVEGQQVGIGLRRPLAGVARIKRPQRLARGGAARRGCARASGATPRADSAKIACRATQRREVFGRSFIRDSQGRRRFFDASARCEFLDGARADAATRHNSLS